MFEIVSCWIYIYIYMCVCVCVCVYVCVYSIDVLELVDNSHNKKSNISNKNSNNNVMYIAQE